MKNIRLLICGGRNYTDRERIFRSLDAMHLCVGITCLISGMARGADIIGYFWAVSRDIDAAEFPANWKQYKNKAGPIRNQQMLDEGKPDLVLAFPGGRGTQDMIRRAKKAGVRVIELSH